MTRENHNHNKHIAILAQRIGDLFNTQSLVLKFSLNVINNVPLFQVYKKEDYERIKQMLWDEYQHRLEPIDSLKDTAYILQQKIQVP